MTEINKVIKIINKRFSDSVEKLIKSGKFDMATEIQTIKDTITHDIDDLYKKIKKVFN